MPKAHEGAIHAPKESLVVEHDHADRFLPHEVHHFFIDKPCRIGGRVFACESNEFVVVAKRTAGLTPWNTRSSGPSEFTTLYLRIALPALTSTVRSPHKPSKRSVQESVAAHHPGISDAGYSERSSGSDLRNRTTLARTAGEVVRPARFVGLLHSNAGQRGKEPARQRRLVGRRSGLAFAPLS